MYLDDYNLSATIDFKFTTRKSTGLPTQLAGSPAVSVYKTNSTTQTTTGVTLTVDFDSVTGLNHVRIDTSADGTFYAAGCDFAVVITAGTVDSISVVGETVATFSILNRSALRPTTAGQTLNTSYVDAAVSSRMATYTQPSGFLAATFPTTVASTTNITAATGVTVSAIGNGVITAASIAADAITDAKVASDVTIASVTGAVGSVTGNVGGSVASIATGGITAASFAAGAIDAAAIAADAIGASELAADAVAEIQSGLATAENLATVAGYLDTEIADILADTNDIQTRLPAALTADGNIKADTLRVNGTAQTAGDLAALITAVDDYIDTEVAAIKAKTDQLTFTAPLHVDATANATLSAGDITDIAEQVAELVSDTLAGEPIIVNSPFAAGGALTIYAGDDYLASMGTSLTATISGRSDLVGLIPHLVGKSGTTFDLTASSVVSGTETLTFSDLTSAVSELLTAGSGGTLRAGTYQIQFRDGSGNTTTAIQGIMYVGRRIEP